jgi:hypothetical protein
MEPTLHPYHGTRLRKGPGCCGSHMAHHERQLKPSRIAPIPSQFPPLLSKSSSRCRPVRACTLAFFAPLAAAFAVLNLVGPLTPLHPRPRRRRRSPPPKTLLAAAALPTETELELSTTNGPGCAREGTQGGLGCVRAVWAACVVKCIASAGRRMVQTTTPFLARSQCRLAIVAM